MERAPPRVARFPVLTSRSPLGPGWQWNKSDAAQTQVKAPLPGTSRYPGTNPSGNRNRGSVSGDHPSAAHHCPQVLLVLVLLIPGYKQLYWYANPESEFVRST
eukprot:746165-Rhodomonas_salina.2